MTTLDRVGAYLKAHISLVPILLDGTKHPDGKVLPWFWDADMAKNRRGWTPLKERLPTEKEAREWWGGPRPHGIAAIAGAISGNLEMLDFDQDAEATFSAWREAVEEAVPGLFDRLTVVRSPRPGYHVWYRCPEVELPGNLDLARDPARPAKERVLIQTRGEGGYAVVPGSPAECHPSGRTWELLSGPPLERVPDLSIDEREALFCAARALDREIRIDPPPRATGAASPGPGLRPGDDFERRGTWEELLGPLGWVVARVAGDVTYWRRPDKDRGWSATTGKCRGADGADLLRVFTSSSAFEAGKSYGKFRAYAVAHHAGDCKAAAKDLAARGYGSPSPPPRPGTNGYHAGNGKAPEGPPPAPPGEAAAEAEITVEPTAWPAPPGEAAYHGLAGDLVRLIMPQTEADPVAILAQVLVMFGSAIGRTAHWTVEGDRHHGNLYACLVGETAKGRKGTSKGRAMQAMGKVEDGWRQRVMSGLSSGEGLIHAIRDPVYELHHVKQKGRVVDTQMVKADDGERDKRLMIVEPEFGRVLRVMEREGNTLSARLREGWDGADMANMTKVKMRATGPHVSLVGHVTRCELVKLLSGVDAANGLANRFLWVAVRRSQLLPLGGAGVDMDLPAHKVALAAEEARKLGPVPFAEAAAELWCGESYARLSAGRPGLLGAILNRAEAQVRRLAMLYALLDFRQEVRVEHLKAALALWAYCERSAAWAFGESTGSRLGDDLLDALRAAGAHGMTGRDLHAVTGRHASAREIKEALTTLLEAGQARFETRSTGGRPVQRWFAGREQSEQSEQSGGATT